MSVLDYFHPNNVGSVVIVRAELAIFSCWMFLLVWQVARALSAKKSFQLLDQAISELEAVVLNQGLVKGSIGRAQNSFDIAVSNQGTVAVVAREHLWILFSAGYRDSDIDVSELIRKTDEQIFRFDSAIRNAIGVFVVLGLLGTLLSVSDAIRMLSIQDRVNVREFIQGLSGAFAPSLLGVLISVVGALIYAVLQILRTDTRVLVRDRTVRDWAPRLRPPAMRRLQEASERTLAAAGEVVRFADDINTHTEAWSIAVSASKVSAQTIEEAMRSMSGAVGSARSTAEALLAGMNSKLEALNQSLGEWASIGPQIIELKEVAVESQRQQAALSAEIARNGNRIAIASEELQCKTVAAMDRLNEGVLSLGTPLQGVADRVIEVATGFTQSCNALTSSLATDVDKIADGVRSEIKAGWADANSLVAATNENLTKSAGRLSDVFGEAIAALRQGHSDELLTVKSYFARLSEELSGRAAEIVRILQSLGVPFENAAKEVQNASLASARRITTSALEMTNDVTKILSEAKLGDPVASVVESRETLSHLKAMGAVVGAIAGDVGAVASRSAAIESKQGEILEAVRSIKDPIASDYSQPANAMDVPNVVRNSVPKVAAYDLPRQATILAENSAAGRIAKWPIRKWLARVYRSAKRRIGIRGRRA